MTASTELNVEQVAERYAVTRDSLVVQLRTLSTAEADVLVPSCPDWRVRDVVAHVAGLVADVIAGVPPPLGSDRNTARQVGDRRAMTLDEICDDWQANGAAFAPLLVEDERRALGLNADLTVHVHDLAETIDSIAVPSLRATRAGCQLYVRLLQERVAERLDVALTVVLDGDERVPTAGSTPLVMTGTSTDFLRSVTGRRTRARAESSFDWSGDPAAMLDQAFVQYGAFRT